MAMDCFVGDCARQVIVEPVEVSEAAQKWARIMAHGAPVWDPHLFWGFGIRLWYHLQAGGGGPKLEHHVALNHKKLEKFYSTRFRRSIFRPSKVTTSYSDTGKSEDGDFNP